MMKNNMNMMLHTIFMARNNSDQESDDYQWPEIMNPFVPQQS